MKSPPILPHLCQMNPTHILYPNFFKIHFPIILPSTTWPYKWLPTKTLYSFLFPPMRATCPTHLIFLASIFLVKLAEEFRLWSSTPCTFLQPSLNSSLLGPNIFLRFVKTLPVIQTTAVYNARSHVVITTCWANPRHANFLGWGGGIGFRERGLLWTPPPPIVT